MHLSKQIESMYDDAVRIRQDLHRIPEIGFQLRDTQAYVLRELKPVSYTHLIKNRLPRRDRCTESHGTRAAGEPERTRPASDGIGQYLSLIHILCPR